MVGDDMGEIGGDLAMPGLIQHWLAARWSEGERGRLPLALVSGVLGML